MPVWGIIVVILIFIVLRKIILLKRMLYALAYSYPIYLFVHNDIIFQLLQKISSSITTDNFYTSPIVGMVSVLLSSILVGIIPSVWKTITDYIELGIIAERAGLFLSHPKAVTMNSDKGFIDYISSIKEIDTVKFKCITGYETFIEESSPFHSIFNTIDATTQKIEILLCNPDGEAIKGRAKLIAKANNLTRQDMIKELQNQIKLTLNYINSLDLPNIKIKFVDENEVKYKILCINKSVFVQGYFGSNDIKNESIFAFKSVDNQVSMFKFFNKLFDEKYANAKKITQISDEYKHL